VLQPTLRGAVRPMPAQDLRVDLAPEILRQRLVVEGTIRQRITPEDIVEYLSGLSEVCGMTPLMTPVTHRSDLYGWAGWIHWEASGVHFYAWEKPLLFFSVDIYTCKAFSPERVIQFTTDFFRADPVVAKAF
jgi:hypothetical protein